MSANAAVVDDFLILKSINSHYDHHNQQQKNRQQQQQQQQRSNSKPFLQINSSSSSTSTTTLNGSTLLLSSNEINPFKNESDHEQSWSALKYLPSRLKMSLNPHNDNDQQQSNQKNPNNYRYANDTSTTLSSSSSSIRKNGKHRKHRKRKRKITYDLKHYRRITSIQILIIWFISLMILTCHLWNCYRSSSSIDQKSINRLICYWLTISISLNFLISNLLLLILQFYICHLIQMFPKISWLFIEMLLSILLIITIFFLFNYNCLFN
ncbi:uncharacterized protein LOC113789999 [Dermatophagoides pteronyssinus]|uniref:uncharacterized protein LOC113789999 n=1 Tax=Dermatophagoides pteronyssinus TaxID=6956 RepID=UPI003F67535C